MGGSGPIGLLMVSGLELEHPRSVLDQVRGVWTSPGPETRGAHHDQRVGDGGHGLTEPESEPKKAMVRRQWWLCPEQWVAVLVGAAIVAWQDRSRRTPGQLWIG
jgi:hypothetical protein